MHGVEKDKNILELSLKIEGEMYEKSFTHTGNCIFHTKPVGSGFKDPAHEQTNKTGFTGDRRSK